VNRCFHAMAFALIGWYLMLPPAGQQNGLPWPDGRASISQWTIAESFDGAKACEGALTAHRKKFEQAYSKLSHQTSDAEFWGRFYVTAAGEATCIATDDPRLKEDAAARPTGVQPSSAN
jgi:hypothetical protein